MKMKFSFILCLACIGLILSSCESENDKNQAPVIPPLSSMVIDFDAFSTELKSSQTAVTHRNFVAAGVTIATWNHVLASILVVPVKAFHHSFESTPVYIGENAWQWSYNVDVLGITHNARLVGTIRENDVKWEMFITRGGIAPLNNFLWFEGTSALDRKSGQWRLNNGPVNPGEVLRVDWQKSGDKVGQVKYTYMFAAATDRADQLTVGSNLTFGLTTNQLNAFYNIVFNTRDRVGQPDLTVNIEWSTAGKQGRIMAPHFFQNPNWHCWNSQRQDVICE